MKLTDEKPLSPAELNDIRQNTKIYASTANLIFRDKERLAKENAELREQIRLLTLRYMTLRAYIRVMNPSHGTRESV